MSFSNYLEVEILDHILGGPDYVRPATVYIAAYTAAPSDAGGGTEVSGGSYAREAVTNNATNFPAASAGAKTNGTDFEFVEATGAWGTISHVGIFDAPTAGNLLGWSALAVAKDIASGDILRFKAGDLDITLD